jgi:UDP-glucose 4-epimerase
VTVQDFRAQDTSRRPGDPAALVASFDRLHAERAWRPEADLHKMVADAWEFARGQRR